MRRLARIVYRITGTLVVLGIGGGLLALVTWIAVVAATTGTVPVVSQTDMNRAFGWVILALVAAGVIGTVSAIAGGDDD